MQALARCAPSHVPDRITKLIDEAVALHQPMRAFSSENRAACGCISQVKSEMHAKARLRAGERG